LTSWRGSWVAALGDRQIEEEEVLGVIDETLVAEGGAQPISDEAGESSSASAKAV
jgi:hypothetical protein